MIPTLGTGRYAMPGGPLNDPTDDAVFFAELKAHVPPTHRGRRARRPRRGPGLRGRGRRPADRADREAMSAGLGIIRNAQGERLDVSYQPGAGLAGRRPGRRRRDRARRDVAQGPALADGAGRCGCRWRGSRRCASRLPATARPKGASRTRCRPRKSATSAASSTRSATGASAESPTPATAWAAPSA